MKHHRLLIAFLLLGAVAIGWWLLRDDYASSIHASLEGDLQSVSFKPHVDREWITVTDPQEMNDCREAVATARQPSSIVSYPPATCPLIFEFKDGRRVDLMMSPIGMCQSSIFQNASTFEPMSYVMLSWDGYFRGADSEAFVSVLRKRNHLIPKDR